MFKILVPVDFSDESAIALKYALNIADKIQGSELTVLYSVHIEGVSVSMINKIKDILVREAQESITSFIEETIPGEASDKPVSTVIAIGKPSDEICRFAAENKINLIVMGTMGAGRLARIFGTVARSVISHSPCPVIVVPPKSRFRQISSILYATDLQELEKETGAVAAFAKLFEAEIHVLHILPEGIETAKLIDIKHITTKLQKQTAYEKIDFNTVMEPNIAKGIEEYSERSKANLIALRPSKKGVVSSIFYSSITGKFVNAPQKPLLILTGI
jgi:nucleotide-binding universal stress UspA family protein